MEKQKIKIDIISDINCPWCYLGEARFQKAQSETINKYAFEVTFKPYELNPNAPQAGEDKQAYFIRNFGPEALPRLNAGSKQLQDSGYAEGVIFNFDKSNTIHNTFNGHRLIWLAGKYEVQAAVARALFQANFTNGENVNDPAVLTRIGTEQGIPIERLVNFFEGEEGKDEVKNMEDQARQAGISGVPAFIINDRYLVSGAQPAETFVNIFQQIAPVYQTITADGNSCEVDGNC